MAKARARAAAYSDDEYQDISRFQRRKSRARRASMRMEDEEDWANQDLGFDSGDQEAANEFWRDAESSGKRSRREKRKWTRTTFGEDREAFNKKVFDEFDEFFNFNDQTDYDPHRDDTRGADIKLELELDFLEAVCGTEKEIEINKRVMCLTCKGRRANVKEQQPRMCFECGGRGSLQGNYGVWKKCPKCDGCGCQVKTPCHSCEGIGVQRMNVIEIATLPKGIKDGQKIKLHHLGHASDCFGSFPGDLLITINVKEHDFFDRKDLTIYSVVDISLSQAVLGTKVTIETIYGKVNIEVEPGTQDGDQVCLKNWGVEPFNPPENYDP